MDVKKLEWDLVKEKYGLQPLPASDIFAGVTEAMNDPLSHMKNHLDPKGSEGTKHDNGKPDLSLVPYIAISTEALALGFGEKKYVLIYIIGILSNQNQDTH